MSIPQTGLEVRARGGATDTSESQSGLHTHAEVSGLGELAISSRRVARRRDGREDEHRASRMAHV